jgi:uncharacterized protein (DUF433 family)
VGATEMRILRDYPHLKPADIKACLAYAARAFKNEIYLSLDKAV